MNGPLEGVKTNLMTIELTRRETEYLMTWHAMQFQYCKQNCDIEGARWHKERHDNLRSAMAVAHA